jgi:hypothetical protein
MAVDLAETRDQANLKACCVAAQERSRSHAAKAFAGNVYLVANPKATRASPGVEMLKGSHDVRGREFDVVLSMLATAHYWTLAAPQNRWSGKMVLSSQEVMLFMK